MTTTDNTPMGQGYWHHTPSGVPIPRCVAELLSEDYFLAARRWNRFEQRAAQLRKHQRFLIGFALEAEHRRRPLTRLYLLRDALNRIRQPGYDLGPARRIATENGNTCWSTVRGPTAEALATPPPETELERAVKVLPASPAENLALMRAALRMPSAARW